jgi:hypothetical protein
MRQLMCTITCFQHGLAACAIGRRSQHLDVGLQHGPPIHQSVHQKGRLLHGHLLFSWHGSSGDATRHQASDED